MEGPLTLIRPMLVAMVAVVTSFVVALWISQLNLSGIEDEVYSIAANAEPSVAFLNGARSELENAGIYADEYVEALASNVGTASVSRDEALLARRQFERSLSAYAHLPFFPGEEERYSELRDALRPVDDSFGVVLDRAGAHDYEAARAEIAQRLRPGIRRADMLISAMVDFDADQAQRGLAAIRGSRRRSTVAAIALGAFSLALACFASVIAFRGLAREALRQQLSEQERARREAAEEALRTRDDFLSLASHELRTPVTSLQLAIQALKRWPAKADDFLTTAERQSRRLSDLVEELIDVAQIHLGSVVLVPSEVDLAALVREVVALRHHDIERARSVVTVGGESTLVGYWDRAHLAHVVLNLLANALKFGPGAPVEITLTRGDGDVARLVVRDHGIGIPPGRLPFVFELFERAVPASRYGGLGLGLYVVRALVEAHGGWIRVESDEGAGSTFTSELPRGGAGP